MRLRRFSEFLLLSTIVTCAPLLAWIAAAQTQERPSQTAETKSPVRPALTTDPVAHDPDDPAIWVHPTDPSRSLILATDKIAAKGGLYVFGLDGRTRQTIAPLDRPNNVDVEYGFRVNGRSVDIAVVTERKQHRLRIFAIDPQTTQLTDLAPAGLPVLAGETGDRSEPMGIALYKRPADGAIFAIVSPKSGGATDYLWQYRLADDGKGKITATRVRRFGAFSGRGPTPSEAGEIEAIAVDDARGFVYYSDERFAIRKWHADPSHPDAARERATFGLDGYDGDREGLAIYTAPDGSAVDGSAVDGGGVEGGGYIVSSDQVPGGTRLHLYRRDGAPGNPHDHTRVAIIPTSADETDGLEVTSRTLPGFAQGLLVMMNSGPRTFHIYRWSDIAPAAASSAAR